MAAVARGLAALGHEVHVLVTPGPGGVPRDPGSPLVSLFSAAWGYGSCGFCGHLPCAPSARASVPTL